MKKQYQPLESETFPEIEKKIAKFWEENRIFERSIDETNDGEFIFYDGPPFANGLPHYGHLLTSFIKDIYARYQTMNGKKTERRFGWDCHGLPAEMEVEKQLGIQGRVDITKYGIEPFNAQCKTSVMKYAADWENYIQKAGRWVNFENDYKTMDISYMESVIWAFKQLHNKGLIYEDYRVMPYSWKAETPLSNFETRMDNSYREKTSKTVTVKFTVTSGKYEGVKLLVWTTTPWTLPSNLMIAVNSAVKYCIVKHNDEKIIVASSLVEKNFKEAEILEEFDGSELIDASYQPLFPYFSTHANAFKVVHGNFVTTEDGTGMVHIAPGFGEDDHELCKKLGIQTVCPIDEKGKFTAEIWNINEDSTKSPNKHIHETVPHGTHVIETERLYTKEITKNDFGAIQKLYQNAEVRKYYGKQVLTDEEIHAEIELYVALKAKFGYSRLMVFEKSTNFFIGLAGIDNVTLNSEEKQIGFTLHKEFWGKGYAAEIGKKLIQTIGVNEISAYAGQDNLQSHKVLEKLGFVNKGKKNYERANYERTHFVLDTGILSLIGRQVFDCNDDIIKFLKKQGSWFKTEQYIHNYPHCWRTDTPLIYKAMPSWYVRVTDFKDEMVENNKNINWVPNHVKDGIFGKWLENARDWSISRNRFWGCPVPVWKTSTFIEKSSPIYDKSRQYKKILFDGGKNHKTLSSLQEVVEYLGKLQQQYPFWSPQEVVVHDGQVRSLPVSTTEDYTQKNICRRYSNIKCIEDIIEFVKDREGGDQDLNVWPIEITFPSNQYVFGSIAEMEEFFGDYYIEQYKLGKNSGYYIQKDGSFKITDLHRPFIDELVAPDPLNPNYTITRVEDVLDCWFESGSMPFASVHFPFADERFKENPENFVATAETKLPCPSNFPADFIVEYTAQTRGWFYTLMVLGTALFGREPFKNCICHGVILDESGQKLSKRLRNYPDPLEVFDTIGSDAMRYFVVSSPVVNGGDLFIPKTSQGIAEILRLIIKPIWNSYNFFAMYANSDGITAEKSYASTNTMDIYILSKLREFLEGFKREMDSYNTQTACKLIEDFIEVLNNWYIRRNKERFWKVEKDEDKTTAYNTLYTVILDFITAIAPILPFTSEAIFQKMINQD